MNIENSINHHSTLSGIIYCTLCILLYLQLISCCMYASCFTCSESILSLFLPSGNEGIKVGRPSLHPMMEPKGTYVYIVCVLGTYMYCTCVHTVSTRFMCCTCVHTVLYALDIRTYVLYRYTYTISIP